MCIFDFLFTYLRLLASCRSCWNCDVRGEKAHTKNSCVPFLDKDRFSDYFKSVLSEVVFHQNIFLAKNGMQEFSKVFSRLRRHDLTCGEYPGGLIALKCTKLTIDFVRSGRAEIGGGGGSSSCSELVAHASVGVLLGLLLLTL